jgi:hypothetical protein
MKRNISIVKTTVALTVGFPFRYRSLVFFPSTTLTEPALNAMGWDL